MNTEHRGAEIEGGSGARGVVRRGAISYGPRGATPLRVAHQHTPLQGPWNFDTHVPIAFRGGGLRAQRLVRPVDPRDIAPALAPLLKIPAPRGSSGEVLSEITRAER